jgi:hypothetical protein
MTPGPLSILRDTAVAHFALPVDVANDYTIFDVSPPLPSGAPAPTYRLRVEAVGDYVTVRELKPTLLPEFCPERHINYNGAFCLYWAEAEPSSISDADAAAVWWMKTLTFLRRQQSAATLRQWPGKSDARAHGPEAAMQQAIAERSADLLGARFRGFLADSRLKSIRKKSSGEPRLRLLLDGQRLLSLRERSHQLMTKRSRCKCDDAHLLRLPICACGNHEAALRSITLALARWEKAERDFFREYAASGRKCCGTIEGCPLAA